MKSAKCLIYTIISGMLFYSCTLVTEPERFYNHEAFPPEYQNYNFENIARGQHVDGIIRLNFEPQGINNTDITVRVAIDDKLEYYFDRLPITLDINTRNYPEGDHTIYFYIYYGNSSLGLLNVVGAPNKVFETNLYFDRTPPDSVKLSAAIINGKDVQLNWTKSTSITFYSYLIYKSVNDGAFILIDTILNKNITSYNDTTGLDLIGVKYQYKVAVTNDNKFSSQSGSNISGILFGDKIKYNFVKLIDGPWLNEEYDELYYIVDDKLVSFSSLNNVFKNELDLTGFLGQYYGILFAFNKDRSKIYLFNSVGNKLWIINSNNLTVVKKLNLSDGGDQLYVIDDSRIILNSYFKMTIFNTENNQLINSVVFPLSKTASSAALTNNNSRMIINAMISGNSYLEVMDVTGNNFNIIDSVKTYDKQYLSMKISGNKLYCDGQSIYDAGTLSGLGSLEPKNNINSFDVSGSNVALLKSGNYFIPDLYNITCKIISIYNSSDQLVKNYYLNCGYTIALGKSKVFIAVDKNNLPGDNILGYLLNIGE